MKLYKFLFYKFYSFSEFIGGGSSTNEANASFNMVIFLSFNILSIKYFIERMTNKALPGGIVDLLPFVVTGLIVYFTSLSKKQYLSYKQLFADAPKMLNIVFVIYCISTIALFFYLYNLHLAIVK